jgi:hypothetical protein
MLLTNIKGVLDYLYHLVRVWKWFKIMINILSSWVSCTNLSMMNSTKLSICDIGKLDEAHHPLIIVWCIRLNNP